MWGEYRIWPTCASIAIDSELSNVFWDQVEKRKVQTYYQINPSIADNCLSYKHLLWACSDRKVHNKPPWILPFAVVTEGIFLSAGDMASWGQKLSVAEEKGWRLEEILPDEAILWSFCSYLSSSKRMKELKLLPKVIFIHFLIPEYQTLVVSVCCTKSYDHK